MRSISKLSLALVTAALMSGPALVQTALAQDTAAPAAPADNSGLDMGADSAGATPQVGQTYRKETIGDWMLDCVKTEDGQDEPCQMSQLMRQEDGNPIATATFFRTPEGSQAALGASIMVPLETLLPAGLRLGIDGGQEKVYNFSFCNKNGCIARVGFTAAELAAFKNGSSASLKIRPFAAPDVEVPMTLSLKGFTAAFDKVTAVPGGKPAN